MIEDLPTLDRIISAIGSLTWESVGDGILDVIGGLILIGLFVVLVVALAGFLLKVLLYVAMGVGILFLIGLYVVFLPILIPLGVLGGVLLMIKSLHMRVKSLLNNEPSQKQHSEYRQDTNAKQSSTVENSEPVSNPFIILGLASIATREEVEKAYRQKMKQNHPDKTIQLDPEIQKFAQERAKIINRAYEEAMYLAS